MHPVTRHHLARRSSSRRRAFTLIELIVTIVILGILAALAVPAFNAVIDRSRDSQAEQTWSAVLREAQALAAFEDRAVSAQDIADALGDMAGAGLVEHAGAPYAYDDGDGVLAAGEWMVDDTDTPTALVATDAALDERDMIVAAAVTSPGATPVVEVRDHDADDDGDHDADDAAAHLAAPPAAGGDAGGEAGGSGYPADAMVLSFDSTLAGASPAGTVSVALVGADATIDWGDGTVEPVSGNGPFSHAYATPGEHTVQITGTATGYNSSSYGAGDQSRLVAVEQWGDLSMSSLVRAFYNADNLTDVPADLPTGVTTLHRAFFGASSFNDPDVATWDTTSVNNMTFTFNYASSFNADISGWNTANVTNMEYMFQNATSFDQDISEWDTSSVTRMFAMFYSATSFNQDLAGWDVDQVTSCTYALYNTTSWTLPKPAFSSCSP